MAIINCPNCSKRISSLAAVCPHCDLPLKEMSAEDQKRLETRRFNRKVDRAFNLSYLGLLALVVGALWWWFGGAEGWHLPPPIPAFLLVFLGGLVYFFARGWLFWMRMNRRRGR